MIGTSHDHIHHSFQVVGDGLLSNRSTECARKAFSPPAMPPQRLARLREGLGRVPSGSEASYDHIHYSFQVIGDGLVVEPDHPNAL